MDEEGCAPTRRVVPVESVLAVVTGVLVRLVLHGVEFPGAGVESVLGEGAEVVAEGSAVVVPVVKSAFLQEGVDVVEESLEGDLHRAWEAGVERTRGRSWLGGDRAALDRARPARRQCYLRYLRASFLAWTVLLFPVLERYFGSPAGFVTDDVVVAERGGRHGSINP